MNRPIRIISTGGTIDSSVDYNPNEKSVFQGTNLPAMLEQARVTLQIQVEPLMQKDSADITDTDRTLMLKHCRECPENNLVITHGTDTMSETARFLGNNTVDGKTVVLVGSFVPFSQEHSDAFFNFGYALAAAQILPVGVYVAMGGEIFSWDKVRKNVNKQVFENISA